MDTVHVHKVKYATVKELRRASGKLIAAVNAGERSFAEAWQGVETALRRSKPAYATVDEALDHSRRRPTAG